MTGTVPRVLWVLGPQASSETLELTRRLLAALVAEGVSGSLWALGKPPDWSETVGAVHSGSGWIALARMARRFDGVHALNRSAHGAVSGVGLVLRGSPLLSYLGEDPPQRPPWHWGRGLRVLPHAAAGWPASTPVVGEAVPHHPPNVNRVRAWLEGQGLRAQHYVGWVGSTQEGVRLAQAALTALRGQGWDVALLVLGWGAPPEKPLAQARWIDRRSDPQAADFFWAMNALLVTEGSPAARTGVLEAFQHRVPVVGQGGLLPDLLTEGRSYVGADPVGTLREAWADGPGTAARVEAAFAWVQRRHRPEAVARCWLDLYRQAAGH